MDLFPARASGNFICKPATFFLSLFSAPDKVDASNMGILCSRMVIETFGEMRFLVSTAE